VTATPPTYNKQFYAVPAVQLVFHDARAHVLLFLPATKSFLSLLQAVQGPRVSNCA